MKKLIFVFLVALSATGCVIESDEIFYHDTYTEYDDSCSPMRYDYSHTEFECPRYSVEYVFCHPHDEPRIATRERPGCIYESEAPETYNQACSYPYHVCWR